MRALTLISSVALSFAYAGTVSAGDYFIKNARLYGDELSAPHISILIKEDRIAYIGTNIENTSGTTIIDAKGRIVTPALMNSATKLGLIELHSIKETVDYNGSSDELGADFDVQYSLNPNSALLDIARTEGLARAATLPGGTNKTHFLGTGALLHLRKGHEILDKPQAALVVKAGGTGTGNSSRGAVWIKLRKEFSNAAKEEKKPSEAPSIIKRVLEGSTSLVIEASRESDLRQAVAFANEFKIHLIIVGAQEAWRVAPELAASNIAVILTPFASLPSTYDTIGARGDNAKILHDAGVLIGFSVDSIFVSHNAGNAMRLSAGFAAAQGLSKTAALEAMTKNPAAIWGISQDYGTLETGKIADIVIWSGDPLEPLSNPDMVFIDGDMVTVRSRHMQLRDKYHPHKRAKKAPSIPTDKSQPEP